MRITFKILSPPRSIGGNLPTGNIYPVDLGVSCPPFFALNKDKEAAQTIMWLTVSYGKKFWLVHLISNRYAVRCLPHTSIDNVATRRNVRLSVGKSYGLRLRYLVLPGSRSSTTHILRLVKDNPWIFPLALSDSPRNLRP